MSSIVDPCPHCGREPLASLRERAKAEFLARVKGNAAMKSHSSQEGSATLVVFVADRHAPEAGALYVAMHDVQDQFPEAELDIWISEAKGP